MRPKPRLLVRGDHGLSTMAGICSAGASGSGHAYRALGSSSGLGANRPYSDNLEANRQFLAKLGENFYYGAAGIQLALALLVAPAATAGSVCVDRARGWLAHMFVTELSDAEIVLGKLAARFASFVALVFASLPVLAIVGLLGGIIPEAIMILVVVTLTGGAPGLFAGSGPVGAGVEDA